MGISVSMYAYQTDTARGGLCASGGNVMYVEIGSIRIYIWWQCTASRLSKVGITISSKNQIEHSSPSWFSSYRSLEASLEFADALSAPPAYYR